MPRLLLLNHVVLLLCCSIYLGTGFSLVFFQLPLEPDLTPANYHLIFVAPVTAATHFFTYMTIVMLVAVVLMLATEWLSGIRWVPVVVLLCLVASTLLTIQVIIPLNKQLATGVSDPGILKTVFREWANLNRVRFALWVVQWAAMANWFYRMALQARADR